MPPARLCALMLRQVGRGQEFKPTGAGRMGKHEDYDPSLVYPHVGTGYAETEEIQVAQR